MTDTSTPQSHERSVAALALLLWAQAAVLGLYFIADMLVAVQSQLAASFSEEAVQNMLVGTSLLRLIPLGLVALGMVRLAAPLVDAGARRWGHAAAVVRGLAVAALLGRHAFNLLSEDPGSLDPVLRMVPGVLLVLSSAVLLMAVRAGSQALGVRPARGLLFFAAGSLVLDLAGLVLLNPSVGPGRELLFSNNGVFSLLTDVRVALSLSAEAALVGLFFLLRAALRPGERPGSGWTGASRGLALYNWGLRGRIAVAVLSLAVPWFLSALSLYRLGDMAGGLIGLAALPCFALMMGGLGQYALRLEEPRARDPALVALGFIVVAGELLLSLSLSTFRGFDAREGSQPLLGTVVAGGVSSFALFFLLASFYRVATALHATELAGRAVAVGRLLAVSFLASATFAFFDSRLWLVRLLSFVAGLGLLVGVVHFLMLVGRVVERMRAGEAPAAPESAPPGMFARV
jgi:hypothetical protein